MDELEGKLAGGKGVKELGHENSNGGKYQTSHVPEVWERTSATFADEGDTGTGTTENGGVKGVPVRALRLEILRT